MNLKSWRRELKNEFIDIDGNKISIYKNLEESKPIIYNNESISLKEAGEFIRKNERELDKIPGIVSSGVLCPINNEELDFLKSGYKKSVSAEEEKEIKEYEEFRRLPEKFQKRLLSLEKGLLPKYKELDNRSKNQFEEVIEQSALMFNDESIPYEDKEKVLMAIQSAFFDAKQKNKKKK